MMMTNPDLSRKDPSPQRPLLVSFFAHVVIGYSLYVVALAQAEPPAWAIGVIDQLKPTLGALETAARLSERPFSAQVMILYAVLSAVLLGMYWVSYIFLVKHIGQEMYRRLCEQWRHTGLPFKERLGFFGFGLAQLYLFGYAVPIHSFVEGGLMLRGRYVGWVDPALFSSSILSTTLLLLVSAVAGAACVLGPLSLYLSISRVQSPTAIRS